MKRLNHIEKKRQEQRKTIYKILPKISNLVENQSETTIKGPNSWKDIKHQNLYKNHRKPNVRNSKPKMRKAITKKEGYQSFLHIINQHVNS